MSVVSAVTAAVSQVCDPEYPDLTIADLGILEKVWLRPQAEQIPPQVQQTPPSVVIDLIPTMLGCPALAVIERDVRSAAQAALAAGAPDVSVPGSAPSEIPDIEVRMLTEPAWTPSRISESAREFLGREYIIAVRLKSQTPPCPNCDSTDLEFRSDFGPTPCRKIYWCPACRNPVEMIESRMRDIAAAGSTDTAAGIDIAAVTAGSA